MKKKLLSFSLCLFVLAFSLVSTVAAAGEKFSANLSAGSAVAENSDIVVDISITGLAAGCSLTSVGFKLNFDPAVVDAPYEQLDAGDDSIIVSAPNPTKKWEQIVTKKGGSYYDCFFMPVDGGWTGNAPSDSVLTSGKELKLRFTFKPKTGSIGKAANFSVTDVEGYDAKDKTLTNVFTGNGSALSVSIIKPNSPVTTLGAKINTVEPALRLGAKYVPEYLPENKTSFDVSDLGIVLTRTSFLNGAELTLDTETAIYASANGIENFDPQKTFTDYTEITFYVTIINLPANGRDADFSFRAYCTYDNKTLYSETMVRSYNDVYNSVYPTLASGEGDNVIYADSRWFK